MSRKFQESDEVIVEASMAYQNILLSEGINFFGHGPLTIISCY